MKKFWFARIRVSNEDYGRWVSSGQEDLEAARDYIREVYGGPVREWLQFPVAF